MKNRPRHICTPHSARFAARLRLGGYAADFCCTQLHGLGSSINCLGRRVASYTTRDTKEIAKLLAMVP